MPAGLPHSAISGSRDVCSSPKLFAAYHGLLRQRAPRHPPWTLSRLTILSFHPSSSGIRFQSPTAGSPHIFSFSSALSTLSSSGSTHSCPPPKRTDNARGTLSHLSSCQRTVRPAAAVGFNSFLEVWGFEPQTYGLQSRRSSRLSYTPSS